MSEASETEVAGAMPRPGPAGDRDALADERLRKCAGRKERRRERGPALRAIDDEGRERRRLAADEVLLPARGAALRVVERLVAEYSSAHRADPAPANRRREAFEVGRRESRVAEALQYEIAVPGGAGTRADAVDLGVEAVPGAEARERRPGDGDLLVRRRRDRQRLVVREDDRRPSTRSTARAAVRPSESDGAVSAFASFGSSPPARPPSRAAAAAQANAATRAGAPDRASSAQP